MTGERAEAHGAEDAKVARDTDTDERRYASDGAPQTREGNAPNLALSERAFFRLFFSIVACGLASLGLR